MDNPCCSCKLTRSGHAALVLASSSVLAALSKTHEDRNSDARRKSRKHEICLTNCLLRAARTHRRHGRRAPVDEAQHHRPRTGRLRDDTGHPVRGSPRPLVVVVGRLPQRIPVRWDYCCPLAPPLLFLATCRSKIPVRWDMLDGQCSISNERSASWGGRGAPQVGGESTSLRGRGAL